MPGWRPCCWSIASPGCGCGRRSASGPFAALAAGAVLTFPGRGEFYGLVHGKPEAGVTRYIAEGVDAVVVTYSGLGVTDNYINGLSHGDRPAAWYTREAFEAFSYAPQCRDVLVIGFGAGTFVENALWVDEVEHVTLVEISRSVIDNFTKIPEYRQMLTNPPDKPQRLSVIIDDGRRFLLQTDHKYDMILIDPLRTIDLLQQQPLLAGVLRAGPPATSSPRGCSWRGWTTIGSFPTRWPVFFPRCGNTVSASTWASVWPRTCRLSRTRTWRASSVRHTRRNTPRRCWRRLDVAWYLGDESYIRDVNANCPTARDWKPVMEYYFWREFQRAGWKKKANP